MLVTIGIPTYERFLFLKEAVASALGQTYKEIEVLISDDGTNGDIERWSRSMEVQDSRIRYQRTRGNSGLAGNWNCVANAARGEFLAIIGDDDRLMPEFVARMVEALQSQDRLAFSNHYVINAKGERLAEETARFARLYMRDKLSPGDVDAEVCAWQNAIPMSSTLFRTADIKRLGFKEDLNTPEIELLTRLAYEGGGFKFVSEYLVEYRLHGNSATAGGLRTDRLARYLLSTRVSTHAETYKQALLSHLVPRAVTQALCDGDVANARLFQRTAYYRTADLPAVRKAVHAILLAIPLLGGPLCKSGLRLRDLLVSLVRSARAIVSAGPKIRVLS